MEKLTKKDIGLVGIMIFSLFFGAGNLIFPPFLGQNAGRATPLAMLGFIITAVGIPILGIIVIAKNGSLYNLASRVGEKFASYFNLVVCLTIGPFLGVPRAGSLPFEMAIAPFIPSNPLVVRLALLAYTLVFFTLVYRLCLKPGKLVDRMGKCISPILLGLLLLIFLKTIFNTNLIDLGPSGSYRERPFLQGFLDGYMTLDAISALNFGFVIAGIIKAQGVEDRSSIVAYSKKAGLVAFFILSSIYSILAYIGRVSGGILSPGLNGAETLGNIMVYLFARPGQIMLALVFSLACLNSAIGVITAISQSLAERYPKFAYRSLVRVISLVSLLIANLGLDQIIRVSMPLLNMVYPMAIVLIILSLFDSYFKNQYIYRFSVYFTGISSILFVLEDLGLPLTLIRQLPLYEIELVWVLPAILGIFMGLAYKAYLKYKGSYEEVLESLE